MFKELNKKSKLQQGFTIIEVMIVLAIAGLILVVVLIAIPQLQRNQRNSARQSNLARMVSEISNYAGNNNGSIPVGQTEIDDMYERYLGTDINTEDPTTGASTPILARTFIAGPVSLNDDPATITVNAATGVATNTTPANNLGVAYYMTGASCDGESVNLSGVGGRNFVVISPLEGGAIYCLDNK
jgi:prepilin-type N-terminal cleavage/methylation domain-containing protein